MNYAIDRAYKYVDNEGWSIDYIKEQIEKELTQEKTEWEVEIETEVVPDFEKRGRVNDGQIFHTTRRVQTLITNGYVKILKIK